MTSTVATKFIIPVLNPRLVNRPRIMQLFHLGLHCHLTLVTAPAGYGKTTGVALWLHSLDDPSIKKTWYALDPEDDDYSTFFTRFVAALETVAPGSLATVATGITVQGVPPANYANSLADACLNLPCEVVLVLDDYHLITAPDIHAVLAHCIQYASSKLHLVIVTRHDPALPIARLRARQQLAEVRADDLRLTDAEASALLALRLPNAASPALVAVLQARTEGWAAGLQLAAASLSREPDGEFLDHLRRHENLHVADFLIDEVLDHASVPAKEFLLKTALVARFNVELAATMTGFAASTCGDIVEQLRKQNMFLVVLDRDGTLFRYHHEFRAMLQNRAVVMYPVDSIGAIRRDAIDWLLSHGWIDEAIDEYIAECIWDQAADLVETDRHRLQNSQEWDHLWRRISCLPDEVVARRPGLLLAKAWILQIYGRYAAMALLAEQSRDVAVI